ncbi:Putative glycoside hydrolase, family 3, glycoside hydrolase family 3 domain, immunoglobulin [Colletotrichum destructivum]|uniref:beta-glucosidase n=1 Tax=Colletotrichum destructivum TaxID=34406 RepID=A0AAX4I1E1_9PEZI|nr:Putative glycoside hydrolase, family 3, glycoside hydrolase family 3 domain, immunoglobulin [Colletotrichum destructivum]
MTIVPAPSKVAIFDVEDVLSKLTLHEKAELLSGIDFWHTQSVPRLGVPSIRLSDGPNGVRGTRFFNGVAAACFPCGTGLAATWDTALLEQAGNLMGLEARAKGVHVLLGPTVNMQRSPLGGRGFESFSEDPVLAGLCASSVVLGIQSTGVQAAIKHFVANDQEHERMAVSSVVTERALREIYLMPFQIAVRDAHPASFMTSYNKVNGTHVSEDENLLQNVLRGEWKWEGLVMSDWYGTYSTVEALEAGLDLEMPGPSRWRGQLVNHAVSSKKLLPDTIDQRVRAVLKSVQRAVATGIPEHAEEEGRDLPETAALLRQIAGDSVVLLKNEKKTLPFHKTKTVLIIGPNAKVATYCGGGSATLRPYYAVTPFEAISKKAQNVIYSPGCHAHKMLPILGPRLRTEGGQAGVTFNAFDKPESDTKRKPVDTIHLIDTNMYFADYYHPALTEDLWWGEIEASYTADDTGPFEFGLCVHGTARLYVDGELLIDNETVQRGGGSFFNVGTVEETGILHVVAGQTYKIKVIFASGAASKVKDAEGVVSFGGGGVRIGGAEVLDADKEIDRAAELAKSVDQVVVCVGLNADFEQEGHDRQHMSLPGRTDELISAVAAANPSTTVVVQSGTPVAMPWAASVSAIIQAWYGGNETGNAIADVLFGDTNPSGKLPLSFPIRVEDNPAFLNYRSDNGRVLYGEDVFVGYRYYEAVKRAVLYPFGWGLSYTSFVINGLHVLHEFVDGDEKLLVRGVVSNEGEVLGSEVIQVYVSPCNPSVSRPSKELKGFTKVRVSAGASASVQVLVSKKYALSFWDEPRRKWVIEAGNYDIFVGPNSVETHLAATISVEKTTWWSGL